MTEDEFRAEVAYQIALGHSLAAQGKPFALTEAQRLEGIAEVERCVREWKNNG
jgi:hypothetical protein